MMRAADIAFALAAALPLSAAGLIAGAALERAGVSARVRERVGSMAFWLGPAACALAVFADALPQPTTAEITIVLRGTPLAALSQAARALAQAPHIHLPRVAELMLGLIAVGAALRLIRLGRALLAVRALRRDAIAAPVGTVQAIRAAGVRPSIAVRLSAGAPTPIAVGLFKPEILLPGRFGLPETAPLAGLVCRHEARHIERRDNLRLVLEQLAAALLWFDPLRGALHRRLLAAREERCDAAALTGRTPVERTLYARTLLEELTQGASPALAAGLIGLGRHHAMGRISAIVDPRPARRRPVLTVAVCAALAVTGAGLAYAASQTAPSAPEWMDKVASAVAAVRPALPRAFAHGDTAPLRSAMGETGRPARPKLLRVADAAQDLLTEPLAAAPAAAVRSADDLGLDDDMFVFVNGDMDTDDMNKLLSQLASTRGLQPTADSRPLLQQAILRRVTDEPRINVEADNVQKFDGVTRFAGNVEVTGDLRRAFWGASMRVDDRAAPADLVLTSRLVADAVEFKRVSSMAPGQNKFLSVEIHHLHLAQ